MKNKKNDSLELWGKLNVGSLLTLNNTSIQQSGFINHKYVYYFLNSNKAKLEYLIIIHKPKIFETAFVPWCFFWRGKKIFVYMNLVEMMNYKVSGHIYDICEGHSINA